MHPYFSLKAIIADDNRVKNIFDNLHALLLSNN